MNRMQRNAQSVRLACDGAAILLGAVALVNLVNGDKTLGWWLVLASSIALALGQIVRFLVKGSVADFTKRPKGRIH
jgi:hypothetical protein